MTSSLFQTAQSIAQGIANTLRSALQISSPSKVGIAIGKNFTLSIAEGLEDGMWELERVVDDIADIMDDAGIFGGSLPIDKMVPMLAGTAAAAANHIDRGIVVNFYYDGDIAEDMDLRMVAQRLGSYIYEEERSRGLAMI
jgi:hypothetical protein